MQIGDLVKYNGRYGIIAGTDPFSAQIRCHWAEGGWAWVIRWYVEVIVCK
tara:strand:+ start:474 stop:623 length:150 start_codon:yes stop_codon:yes gene_type:complete